MNCYSSWSESDLINATIHGNEAAFGELHARYYPLLYAYAMKKLASHEEAQDILQDLFLYIWNSKEKILYHYDLNAYLFTSVRNRIINCFKHSKVKSDSLQSIARFVQKQTAGVEEELEAKHLRERIERAISQLPPKMKQVFELSRKENLTNQEIADRLDINVLTVKKQIHNSLKFLRSRLLSLLFSTFF